MIIRTNQHLIPHIQNITPDYSHHQDTHPHTYWTGLFSCPEKSANIEINTIINRKQEPYLKLSTVFEIQSLLLYCNWWGKNNNWKPAWDLGTQALKDCFTNQHFSSGSSHTHSEKESLYVGSQPRNSVIPQQEEDGWIKAIKFPSAVIGSTDWKWHAGGHIAADDSHFISTSGHTCRRGSRCRERRALVIKIYCLPLEITGMEGPCISPCHPKAHTQQATRTRGAQ